MKLPLLLLVILAAQGRGQSSFVENAGQWPAHIHYAAVSSSGTVWVEDARIGVFHRARKRALHIDIATVHAVEGLTPSGIASFFIGSDASKWVRGAPAFRRLRLKTQGGDPLTVSLEGGRAKIEASGTRIAVHGASDLWGRSGVLVERAGDIRQAGDTSWAIEGDDVLVWAGFIGGSGVVEDVVQRTETDTSVLVGQSADAAFPTTPGVVQVDPNNSLGLAFVGELAPDGLSFAWATYLGGHVFDSGQAATLLPSGEVAVAGFTFGGFPTTPGAYKTADPGSWDGFVSILANNGTELVASTLFGNDMSAGERPVAIIRAQSGNLVLAGSTQPTGFPVIGDAIHGPVDSSTAGFVAALSPTLDELVMSALIGGDLTDEIEGLVLDDQDRPIVVGRSQSLDFPLTDNAWSSEVPPTATRVGAFAARLSADGTELEVSTMVGGAGFDRALDVDRHPSGEITVVGLTSPESTIPLSPNSIKPFVDVLATDAFVSTFGPDLDVLLQSTLIGGTGSEARGMDVVVDSTGLIILLGDTTSANYPTTPGSFQPETLTPGVGGDEESYVTLIHPSGAPVLYSTYLPLSSGSDLSECAFTANGDVVIGGKAKSPTIYPESEGSTTGDGTAVSPAAALRLTPLPFGVERVSEPDATPAGLLVQGVLSQPSVGARSFGSYCLHAPVWENGWLLVASELDRSSVGGASLDIDVDALILAIPSQADGRGWAERVLPIPDAPELAGAVAYAQWVWPDRQGGWLTSGALRFEVQ